MTQQELVANNKFKDKDQELFFKYNHIQNRNYTKNQNLDLQLFNGEISWPKHKDQNNFSVFIHGSYACNLKCVYCENQHLRSEYVNVVIDEKLVRQVVQKLGSHINFLQWHGGEPLLLPENLLVAVEDEKKKYGYKFRTGIQSNSVLLTEEKEQFLHSLGIHPGTSFDGLYNDESRGKASTDAVLRRIREKPHQTGCLAVVHNKTVDKLIENYEYFKSLSLRRFQTALVRENVIANDNPYLIPNDVALDEVMKYLEYWIHDTNNPVIDSYLVRLVSRILGTGGHCEDSHNECRYLVVDPFGNITLCGHCALEDKICNIEDLSNYADLIYHPKFMEKFYKQKQLVSNCEKTCKWYHSCHGGCMGINYEYNKSYAKPNPRFCEYTQAISERVYDLIKDIDTSDVERYNPIFLQVLADNNYYSLTEIKEIEKRYGSTEELV